MKTTNEEQPTTSPTPFLEDWMSAEKNFWSFRHIREIIPTAVIRASAPQPLQKVPRNIPLETLVEIQGAQGTLEDFLKNNYTDSIVALQGGQSVFEWYAPGVSSDDCHINFSVTKSLTGLLGGMLAETGALDFNADVTDYVPEVAGSAFDAKVQNIFDMAVSLEFSEDYAMNDPLMMEYRQATGWIPGGDEGLYQFLQRVKNKAAEGTEYHYASPTTDIAGWILERASSTRFADLLGTLLWTPLGAETDGSITLDAYGAARAAGGFSCTTRDLAKVGQLLSDGGRGIVPKWFIEDLFNGNRDRWVTGAHFSNFPKGAYRNFWYDTHEHSGVLYAVGIHGQALCIDTKRDIVIAKHSSWPAPLRDDLFADLIVGLGALADELAAQQL